MIYPANTLIFKSHAHNPDALDNLRNWLEQIGVDRNKVRAVQSKAGILSAYLLEDTEI